MSHPDTGQGENAAVSRIPFQPEQWFNIVKHVQQQVSKLLTVLGTQEPPTYVQEWDKVYNNITDLVGRHPEASYYDSNIHLFGNPLTLYDYTTELINMIPPLRAIITVHKLRPPRNDVVELVLRHHTEETASLQREIHAQWQGPISPEKSLSSVDHLPTTHVEIDEVDDGDDKESTHDEEGSEFYNINTPSSRSIAQISPALKQQVETMQVQLNDLTSLGDSMKEQIDNAIKTAVDTIMTKAQENLISANDNLRTSIRDGQQAAARLTGELRTATEAVRHMRTQSEHLTQQATRAKDIATREYAQIRGELTNHHHEIIQEIKDLGDETLARMPTPSPTQQPYPRYRNPDEYNIRKEIVSIRSKKYQEDKTPITCASKDNLFLMYDHLVNVSKQYGVHITDLGDLKIWQNPTKTYPTTFPYEARDFDTEEHYHAAYLSMSLAIATKLKTGIRFGSKYNTAKLLIHEHATDGYEILYHLIATAHPKLMPNKAMRPQKPRFEGDLHQYIASYRNWIHFNENRSTPHIYDSDEIADDVIHAIKSSRWANQLKKGLERAETKLERWKTDVTGSMMFPLELRLEFITQTILQYYVERNIDPFATSHPGTPAARALHTEHPRGRSQQRRYYRDRSNSRQRSNSSTRSRASREDLRECRICGGRHRTDTIGCPHLIRHQRISNFIHTTGEREVQNLIDDALQQRERSQSRDSTRRSQSRTRSNERDT